MIGKGGPLCAAAGEAIARSSQIRVARLRCICLKSCYPMNVARISMG
jgi:hypothetical protein